MDEDDDDLRVPFGFLGGIVGMLIPLSPLTGALPQISCAGDECRQGEATLFAAYADIGPPWGGRQDDEDAWRAWVDDPRGARPVGSDQPSCVSRGAEGDPPLLIEAPFPLGYDPTRAPAGPFACVLVGPDGRAIAARLPAVGRETSLSEPLLAAILEKWLFSAAPGAEPQWVRVRIVQEAPLRNYRY